MIISITVGIALLGVVLTGLLVSLILQYTRQQGLSKHRSTNPGFADLLNYAAVMADGVIVGKNGSLMAAWSFSTDDNAGATDNQRNWAANMINKALLPLGNGWMIHVDVVRKPAPSYLEGISNFNDPLCQAIEEERKRFFTQKGQAYLSYFVLTATYFPPLLAQKKFVELLFEDDAKPSTNTQKTLDVLRQFERDCANLESRLSSVFSLNRLKSTKVANEDGDLTTYDDFLAWLQRCITGIEQPIQLPVNPMYLDSYLGGQDFWGGVIPKIGRQFIQVVAIEGFPLQSTPGMLTNLAELPVEYRWSSRYIFMEPYEAIRHYEKFRSKWRQKIRSIFDQILNIHTGHINLDAQDMVNDADFTIAEINSGTLNQGYYTSVVVLMDEDRDTLEAAARQFEKSINLLGFTARVESVNTIEAYLGSLPGHGVQNLRRPLISTLNLAHLLPTSTIWPGQAKAPCPMYPSNSPALMQTLTQGYTPFWLNMHVRDLGHSMIFGPPGAGKTVLLNTLLAQFRRYPGLRVFGFDFKLGMYPLTAAIKASSHGNSGLYFELASDDDNGLAFCPLQYLDSHEDRAWAMEWIDAILELNGLATTPSQRNEIASALFNMKQSGSKTLTDFVLTVQDNGIRETLKQYTQDGNMGHLLDADHDTLTLSDFTIFEMEKLMHYGNKYSLPVLLYLFRRIEKALNGKPVIIPMDESWLMLSHPVFSQKLRTWLKTLRSKNAIVIMCTQNISDATSSGIFDVILESTATKIFLPNIYAEDKEVSAQYARMGLNQQQVRILATSEPKKHYYYASELGRRLFSLALGPLQLALVGATDQDSVLKIKALEREYGDGWLSIWLAERKLNLQDYLGADLYV